MIGINKQEFEKFLYLKRGRKPGGIKSALEHLLSIERWFEAHNMELNARNVEDFFMAKKREGRKNSTMLTYRGLLHLVELHTGKKLLNDIRLPRAKRERPDVLTSEEITRILAVDVPYGRYHGKSCARLNEVYNVLIEFLYFTGCRRDEALSLMVKHVLSDGLVLFVDTKNGEDRTVYLYPPCYKRVKKLCEGQPSDAHVFRNMRGKKIHGVEFLSELKKRARGANIQKRVWTHLLRHTLASHMAQNGVDFRVTQKILGHKNLNSTIYYEQFNMDRQIEAIHTLPLVQAHLPISDRIKRVKAVVEKLHLSEDVRLEYALKDTTRYGKKGLVVEVFER